MIYFDYAAEIISIVCELVANFNRYRFLTKSFQIFEKLSYKMTIFLMTLYALLFCIYLLFDNKITSKQKLNGTITVYSIKDNNFGSAGLAWGYAHTITRNFNDSWLMSVRFYTVTGNIPGFFDLKIVTYTKDKQICMLYEQQRYDIYKSDLSNFNFVINWNGTDSDNSDQYFYIKTLNMKNI